MPDNFLMEYQFIFQTSMFDGSSCTVSSTLSIFMCILWYLSVAFFALTNDCWCCSFTYALASKAMLKILQARLQQYVNHELPHVQDGFWKGRGTRVQIANIRWIIKKAREFQKNTYLCFIDYAKAFDCVDHNRLWKIFQEMGIADHLTCLLRILYAVQEATDRTGHGQKDWFHEKERERSTSRLDIVSLLI